MAKIKPRLNDMSNSLSEDPRIVFYKRARGTLNRRKDGYRRDGYVTYPEGQASLRGAQAFKDGLSRDQNPWGRPRDELRGDGQGIKYRSRYHSKNWDKGWIKAKLASEQGKDRL